MKPWYSVKTGNKLGASEAQMLADMPEGRQTMIAQNNFRPRLQELVGQRKEIVMEVSREDKVGEANREAGTDPAVACPSAVRISLWPHPASSSGHWR
jgi:hypothetical protein